MAVKPILMSGPMVRAILEGRKTQTRRVLSPDNVRLMRGGISEPITKYTPTKDMLAEALDGATNMRLIEHVLTWDCPGGGYVMANLKYEVGDLLWVREAWQGISTENGPQLTYRATPDYFEIDAWDGPDEGAGPSFNYDRCPGTDFCNWGSDVIREDGPWRPAIHMPKWASRLTLEVTAVKVERLQDISRDDALAEGVQRVGGAMLRWENWSASEGQSGATPQAAFGLLWNSINGPGAWDANPWVVATTFAAHHCNVDDFVARVREAA